VKYYLGFREDTTSWTELEPVKHTSDAMGSDKKYSIQCDAIHAVKIEAFRSDNRGEFTSHALEEFLASSECMRDDSAAHSHERNRVAEWVNRTIVGQAKAMRYRAQLQLFLWAEAARTADYITIRDPTRSQTTTHYELWTSKSAQSLGHLPFDERYGIMVPKTFEESGSPMQLKDILWAVMADIGIGCTATMP